MKIIKNILQWLSILILTSSFIACGSGSSSSDPAQERSEILLTLYNTDVGYELFATDNQSEHLIKDINTQTSDSEIYHLTTSGDYLYFRADDGKHGKEVWRTDGTDTGTIMLTNDTYRTDPESFIDINGTLFFTTDREKLYKSDGTVQGTVLVKNLNESGISYPYFRELTHLNGILYFTADDSNNSDGISDGQLWQSDGTTNGTFKVTNYVEHTPNSLRVFQNSLYFINDSKLIRLNPDNTLTEITTVAENVLVPTQELLYFVVRTADEGAELWRYDGIHDPSLVIDLTVGTSSSYFGNFCDVDGTLFFSMRDVLYKTDGTAAGTLLLQEFEDYIEYMTNFNGKLIFASEDDEDEKIFISDGTVNGTFALSLWDDSDPFFTITNSLVYFCNYDRDHGDELWISNGTAGGTQLLADIQVGSMSSTPRYITLYHNDLYFDATNNTSEGDLFAYKQGEVSLIRNINTTNASSVPVFFTPSGAYTYFIAQDAEHGWELYRTDGTENGTLLLKDIATGREDGISTDKFFAEDLNGTLYFTANDEIGYRLYKTEGTTVTTVLATDLFDFAYDQLNVNGILYFVAHRAGEVNPQHNLYKLEDGLYSEVLDINGSSLAYPKNLINVDDTLYFSIDNDLYTIVNQQAQLLYNSVGDEINHLSNIDGSLYFNYDTKLYTYNNNAVEMIKDIGIGFKSESFLGKEACNFTYFNDLLYFIDDDGAVWQSDGTTANTLKVNTLTHGRFLVSTTKQLYMFNDLASESSIYSIMDTQGAVREFQAPLPSLYSGYSSYSAVVEPIWLTPVGEYLYIYIHYTIDRNDIISFARTDSQGIELIGDTYNIH